WLLQQQDPDRVAAGKRLVGHGADYIVLDDGFQHRRLHRDRDVVCLDATLPFGNGQCLPAGDLREFRSGLRRADVILLTRAGCLSEDLRLQRMTRIAQMVGRDVPLYCCDHAPRDVVRQPSGAVEELAALRGRRVVLWSAIARPQSFRETAALLGCEVVGEQVHRDHHRFTAADVAAAQQKAKAAGAELLTTEKDDARLDAFDVERLVLRIDLRFLDAAPLPGEFLL
ncbi:MAG: tetraacyldisaccharide 4'-kinase, partial [Planctomycetes bacterium]|nr:tetraacyldisaccharide 4'-kinase [Planctomycetota bacterium]